MTCFKGWVKLLIVLINFWVSFEKGFGIFFVNEKPVVDSLLEVSFKPAGFGCFGLLPITLLQLAVDLNLNNIFSLAAGKEGKSLS
jgi:hypothetical protein